MYTGEAMPMTQIDQLGDYAIGTIGYETRIAKGDVISEDKVDELAQRLTTDEFYDDISDELGPNAAGGTFSLVIADALTTGRYRESGQTAKEHAKAVYKYLLDNKNDAESRKIIPRVCVDGRLPVEGSVPNDSVIGGHDDEHGPNCGAQGELAPILRYISQRGADLQRLAANHGVEVDEATHGLIVAKAGALLSDGYVSTGAELREAYVETAGKTSVTTLAGGHAEVAGGINKDKTKRLNRYKIRDAFGEGYDAFGIDVGVFPDAAAAISLTEEEVHQKFVAMLYYNLATTTVLADRSLRLSEHLATA